MPSAWKSRSALPGCVGLLLALCSLTWAVVPHPIAQSYADTVRIAVLSNDFATGPDLCNSVMPGVGTQTRDFVVAALDTAHFKNVKLFNAPYATMDTIKNLFAGRMPHVIVHVNAGWAGLSGTGFSAKLAWAAAYNVGIVEIGDDDATILGPVFGWATFAADRWSPMNTAQWLSDSLDRLFIRLQPEKDVVADSSAYPNFNGLLRNTVRELSGDSTLDFLPYDPYGAASRCEADPDGYTVDTGMEHRVTYMAYQQGYNAVCDTVVDSASPGTDGTCDSIVGAAGQYTCITILEDTIDIGGSPGKRRAVALSFQPQFLEDSMAVRQLVYDAVIYGSMVHMGNPPTPAEVGVRRGSLSLGSRVSMDDARPAMIRVADMQGRTVFAGRTSPDRLRDRASTWRKGVYVMTVVRAGTVRSSSFVVDR